MKAMGLHGRAVPEEDSASPASVTTDDIAPTPPSPCLHDELGDDDATPRQQWSPVQSLVRATSQGSSGASCSGPNLTGSRSSSGTDSSVQHGKSEEGVGLGGGGGSLGKLPANIYAATRGAGHHRCRSVAQPDSPRMRVDVERLDLSALTLGEERASEAGLVAAGLNPGTFSSEPGTDGHGGLGARPSSLGGKPSRHALFVAPGHLGSGPGSPPSSYSVNSEGGFASPRVKRVASPGLPRETGRVRKGHWKKGKAIGVGSCGNVYLGMNEDTGELMAVKEITLEAKERLLCSLYNEIQVMHKLVHPHIVGYLGAELQDSQRKLCIFQEWVPAGSLHSLLDQFGALSDAMTRKYTEQVLEGLTYLHANRVIHRDVKSKNILVDDRGNVKLADFGCALVLKEDDHGEDGVEMSMKGTPLFMAPEMLLKRKCGRRVDVWSLGCAVLEMVTTRPPWADAFKHPTEIIAHFSDNPGPPPLPTNLPPNLRHFLLSCFTWDSERRPSAQELCGHQYLQARPGPAGPDGSPGDHDVPLEEMDRASAVTRMRRCSSASLDLLAVQARQATLGLGIGGPLAGFSSAPSGTFRPPSPRYGPGSINVHHAKRTPTRRRMYTEGGVFPESQALGAAANVRAAALNGGLNGQGSSMHGTTSADLNRKVSPAGRSSPPVSPDKPRRPGRGRGWGGGGSGTITDDDGRLSTMFTGRPRSLSRAEPNDNRSRSNSRQADSPSLSGSFSGNGAASTTAGAALGPSVGGSTVHINLTPVMSKSSGELHRQSVESVREGAGGGVEFCPASDTPPPTVHPLAVARSVSARYPETCGSIAQNEEVVNTPLQQREEVSLAGVWGKARMAPDGNDMPQY